MPGQGFVIDISEDIEGFIQRATLIERDSVPFWTAAALTQTAKDIQAELVAEMARVFDRPTRFTLNALYVKPATKKELTAAVMFKEGFGSIPAWRYLGAEVEGGERSRKSYERRLIQLGAMRANEYAVPGKAAPLDSFGNIPGSFWQVVMADLGAMRDGAQNSTVVSRKRAAKKGRGRYFVLRPDWPASGGAIAGAARNVAPGVYERTGGGAIAPVIAFVKAGAYRRRLDYYGIARAILQRNFARNFAAMRARYPAR
jgi:hypothetical protein